MSTMNFIYTTGNADFDNTSLIEITGPQTKTSDTYFQINTNPTGKIWTHSSLSGWVENPTSTPICNANGYPDITIKIGSVSEDFYRYFDCHVKATYYTTAQQVTTKRIEYYHTITEYEKNTVLTFSSEIINGFTYDSVTFNLVAVRKTFIASFSLVGATSPTPSGIEYPANPTGYGYVTITPLSGGYRIPSSGSIWQNDNGEITLSSQIGNNYTYKIPAYKSWSNLKVILYKYSNIKLPSNTGGLITADPDTTDSSLVNGVLTKSYKVGSTIGLTAQANEGYKFSQWSNNVVSQTIISETLATSQIVIGNTDSTVTATFSHLPIPITVEIDGITTNAFDITKPTAKVYYIDANNIPVQILPNNGTFINTFDAPYGQNTTIKVVPFTNADSNNTNKLIDNGYSVNKWEGTTSLLSTTDNRVFLTNTNTVYATTDGGQTVTIGIQKNGPPPTVTLEVGTSSNSTGFGSVQPQGGLYVSKPAEIVTFTANPSFGSKFSFWETSLNGITYPLTTNGNKITVTTDKAYSIYAQFVTMTEEELQKATAVSFYCPSVQYSSNVVEFEYTNETLTSERIHFRTTFYTDILKNAIISSAFSLYDQKRWFTKNTINNSLTPFPLDGIVVPGTGSSPDNTVVIQYIPDVLPIEYSEQQYQSQTKIFEQTIETPLECGIQYHTYIEKYDIADTFYEVSFNPMIIKCSNVDINSWRENKDKKNWFCSGQGKNDIKISDSGSQSVNPSITTNIYGFYTIAWQSHRENLKPIYSATWDSQKDILYGSGQGLYEHRLLKEGINPKLLTDQAQNTYTSAYVTDNILVNKCSFPKVQTNVQNTEDSFLYSCYPGYKIDASFKDLKMRIYEADTSGSLIINQDKVVSVVDKQDIRLDIAGISGAYAVRFRNTSDKEWNAWVHINNTLSSTEPTAAYSIDSDRFIAPFTLSKINGLRRVCCQVLTLYGITKTIYLDIFVNMDIVEYNVLFYTSMDSAGVFSGQVPSYIGRPIISGNFETVYIKVIFSTPQSNNLKFNVTQEGMLDIYGNDLVEIEGSNGLEFYGSFTVKKDDGLFNKDGLGFISIVYGDDSTNIVTPCISDSTDLYNLMITDQDLIKYSDTTAVEISNIYKTSKVSKVLGLDDVKLLYNKDDERFVFGNPNFFTKEIG